jgi:ribosome-associated protein
MPRTTIKKHAPDASTTPSEATDPRPARAQSAGTSPRAAREFAIEAARLLSDDKCEDVILLDVRNISHVTDFIVIGSGTSERQMQSVLSHVEDLGAERNFKAFRSTSDERSTWLLADFVDVVVHVFEPNTRAHYDLEMLWGDAEKVDWKRDGEAPRRSRSKGDS